MAWFSAPTITTVFVEAVQDAGSSVGDCCRVKAVEFVGQARIKLLVPVRKMRRDGGVRDAAGLKAAICMSHAPELRAAVALNAPEVLAIWSSTMSPSGEVMTRWVKGPGAPKVVAVMPAAKRNCDEPAARCRAVAVAGCSDVESIGLAQAGIFGDAQIDEDCRLVEFHGHGVSAGMDIGAVINCLAHAIAAERGESNLINVRGRIADVRDCCDRIVPTDGEDVGVPGGLRLRVRDRYGELWCLRHRVSLLDERRFDRRHDNWRWIGFEDEDPIAITVTVVAGRSEGSDARVCKW
jgi:hypothetical protein